MPSGIYIRVKKPKPQFCKRKHDTFVVGRDNRGNCRECVRGYSNARYIPHPRPPKQFCPKGHDTFECGRYDKNGQCLRCRIEEHRIDPQRDSRLKQFCLNGHDTAICGRYPSNGGCRDCGKKRWEAQHPKKGPRQHKRFCIHGHDTFEVGRSRYNGSCNECIRLRQKIYYKIHKKERQAYERSRKEKLAPYKKIYGKKWRAEHKEELREYMKDYYIENFDYFSDHAKRWYIMNKKQAKVLHVKQLKILNLDGTPFSMDNYNKAFKKQKGKCAICGVHQSELKKDLVVDHNHKTGIFRGLLCGPCNTGIGMLQDDPKIVKKAHKYLVKG